jgi:hypothetical protein
MIRSAYDKYMIENFNSCVINKVTNNYVDGTLTRASSGIVQVCLDMNYGVGILTAGGCRIPPNLDSCPKPSFCETELKMFVIG